MAENKPKYYTPTQKAAVAKWNSENYDEIKVRVSKGEKDKLKAFAKQHGFSLNCLCTTAIYEFIENILKEVPEHK